MLRYKARQHAYVGQRYSVTVVAFDAALQRLLQRGCQPDDAYTLLLWEREWDATWCGVAVVDGGQAVAAAQAILRGQRVPQSARPGRSLR